MYKRTKGYAIGGKIKRKKMSTGRAMKPKGYNTGGVAKPKGMNTGGVIKPISIFIVNTIANQYGSNPSVVITGNNIADVITITATGGKKNPATSKNTLTIKKIIHLLLLSSIMLCASD